jgi:hypothetical protein
MSDLGVDVSPRTVLSTGFGLVGLKIMSKTSSESCEVLETRELRDHELALVTGARCDVSLIKEAMADFKAGDFLGGLIALGNYNASCRASPAPHGAYD